MENESPKHQNIKTEGISKFIYKYTRMIYYSNKHGYLITKTLCFKDCENLLQKLILITNRVKYILPNRIHGYNAILLPQKIGFLAWI